MDNIYLSPFTQDDNRIVVEGGMSRNLAFATYIKNRIADRIIYLSPNKYIQYLQMLSVFIYERNVRFILQYPNTILVMGSHSKIARWLLKQLIKVIKSSSQHNDFVIDVSDLKYEQGLDLELSGYDWQYLANCELEFFKLPLFFIFASTSMKDYAVKKFGINESHTAVIINGYTQYEENEVTNIQNTLSQVDVIRRTNRLIGIYSGTCNKGRQLEEMLENIKNVSNWYFFIAGPKGEWINEFINTHNIRNVEYLGSVTESSLSTIVKNCDIGLIPYDASKLYYNIAYPTKLSFYIGNGIPYLSTEVFEVTNLQKKFNFGYMSKIEQWPDILSSVKERDINIKKQIIKDKRNEFEWGYLFKKLDKIILGRE